MMAPRTVVLPNRVTCPSVHRQFAQRKCFIAAALYERQISNAADTGENVGILCSRRQALLGLAAGVASLNLGSMVPRPALAGSTGKKDAAG